MSESQPSKVFMFDGNDPEFHQACENARANFKYFWREVAWERRRIVPALDMACVKAPFLDSETLPRPKNAPGVEQMWLSDIDFDGKFVSGVLLNKPNWLKSVKQGDKVRLPLAQISDWMYSISGEVFGAYTVNLMRSKMGHEERDKHDRAWGRNFGDPNKIRVAPEPKKGGGLLKSWFGRHGAEANEHPMSINLAASLKAQLAKKPAMLSSKDERGWTLLHHESLAGSAPTVKVLLEAGADPKAVTNLGMTPLQLATSLNWENVIALLAYQ